MRTWKITYSRQARKDLKILLASPYRHKAIALLEVILSDPFRMPPLFETLLGNHKYSRRINYQHRLVYEVDSEDGVIILLSCWTHYHE